MFACSQSMTYNEMTRAKVNIFLKLFLSIYGLVRLSQENKKNIQRVHCKSL